MSQVRGWDGSWRTRDLQDVAVLLAQRLGTGAHGQAMVQQLTAHLDLPVQQYDV